jgi:multidrug resistance efflux pump
VLFTIDARPLQAQLSQAEANLLKAMAAVRQGQRHRRARRGHCRKQSGSSESRSEIS